MRDLRGHRASPGRRKRYRVNIPPGVHDGTRIRLAGKGEAGPRGGARPGPLRDHAGHALAGLRAADDGNLEVTVPITVAEAIQGGTIEVPTLNGTKRIRIPPGTEHGTVQRLRGRGPAAAWGPRPRGHPLPDRDRRSRATSTASSSEAVDALAEAFQRRKTRARSCFATRPRASGKVNDREAAMATRRPARRDGKRRGSRTLDETRGVFMISVAAELAEMHPQTLRMYEARGLITPKRSAKNTRLYSQRDVERLRRIQQMTSEEGLNLAGVETVLELEEPVKRMRAELARMRERTAEMERRIEREVEAAAALPEGRDRALRRLRCDPRRERADGSDRGRAPAQGRRRRQGLQKRLRRREGDPKAEAILGAIAAGRIAIGVTALLAPGPVLRSFGFDGDDPGGRTLSRMAGARDLGFAALTLAARGDAEALRRAALITGGADAVDCAAFGAAAARGEGLFPTLVLSSLAGAAAAAASAWAAQRL